VDAAARLPPVENLWRFIDHGADMVAFSGGKAIWGPQSTGILCGRRDLIEAAVLNHSPNEDAIGRAAKVSKEEIVGLMVALERYVQRDHAADQNRWHEKCNTIAAAIANIRGVKAVVLQDDWTRPVPELSIRFTSDWAGPSPDVIIEAIVKGDPPIIIRGSRQLRWGEQLFVSLHGLMEREAELVGERLYAVIVGWRGLEMGLAERWRGCDGWKGIHCVDNAPGQGYRRDSRRLRGGADCPATGSNYMKEDIYGKDRGQA